MGVIQKVMWTQDDNAPGQILQYMATDPAAYGLAVTVGALEFATLVPTDFHDGTLVFRTDTNALYMIKNGALQLMLPATSELQHTQFTAPVNVSATTAATANTIVTGGNIAYDGSPILVEFFAPSANTPVLAGAPRIIFTLWDGNTDLGQIGQIGASLSGNVGVYEPINLRQRLTPTVAAHNYNVRAWLSVVGTGVVQADVGGVGKFMPGFIRVTRA